jgi:mono/diheme cytochrome c family protein
MRPKLFDGAEREQRVSAHQGHPRSLTRVRAAAVLVTLATLIGACGGGGRAAKSSAPDLAAARRLFVATGCGACHTLSDARVHGSTGPNFDTSERLNREQLLQGMTEGANGMPSYERRLTLVQRKLLADYLLRVAWQHGPPRGLQ